MKNLIFKRFHRFYKRTTNLKISDYTHELLSKNFKTFSIIGGMPKIVKTYNETESITKLKTIYESLYISYSTDAEKYSKNQTMRNVMRHCLQSLWQEIGKRIKFQNFGNSNYRSREVGETLRTIEKAMLINLVYPATNYDLPMIINYKRAPKLHFLDIGLINYFAKIQSEYINNNDLNSVYKGNAAEQIVRQELIASDLSTNYIPPIWTREKKNSNSELDVLIQFENKIIPIEIKSGPTGTLKSLHQYIDESKTNFAIRIYSNKIKVENLKTPKGNEFKLVNIPHYLSGNIKKVIEKFI